MSILNLAFLLYGVAIGLACVAFADARRMRHAARKAAEVGRRITALDDRIDGLQRHREQP